MFQSRYDALLEQKPDPKRDSYCVGNMQEPPTYTHDWLVSNTIPTHTHIKIKIVYVPDPAT